MRDHDLDPGAGLIPARAGKTCGTGSPAYSQRAHPRACGENEAGDEKGAVFEGSSPRVRGKPSMVCPFGVGVGAHPRACGENRAHTNRTPRSPGSSPRVRGKLVEDGGGQGVVGLIPARAGKTNPRGGGPPATGAHPRACGENASLSNTSPSARGSSPRVRGKRGWPRTRGRRGRLIPARAGKTATAIPAGAAARAHPRACGENGTSTNPWGRTPGSSPRVRGKHRDGRGQRPAFGLIPARAGKTRETLALLVVRWAHPRACGENWAPCVRVSIDWGSSPRVRGKPPSAPTTTRG